MNAITSREEVPPWTQGLSQEDINSMHRMYKINLNKNIFTFIFHIFILNELCLYRTRCIITSWFNLGNKKIIRSSISIGC